MEQNYIVEGAGCNQAPAPFPRIHDDQYDMEVYPAAIPGKVFMDILVPVHAKIELTIKCLNSIYNFTQQPFHLLIMNDAPIDDYGLTEKYVREQQKKHRNITYCHSNIPFKTGNTFFNAGLKYARTEIFVTCMNSMQVEPAWEIMALDLMAKDPQIGTIGFKCLFPNGLIESAGISFMGHVPVDMGRDQPGYRMNEIREAQAVQWAFAMHRKKALDGNLDDSVFNGHVGWDDIDNCIVLRSKGWKIIYCGLGCGIHQPRATRGSNSDQAARLNHENAQKFFKRWGLWNTYIGGQQMDVKELIKYETKDQLTQAVTQLQVLQGLIRMAEGTVQELANKALAELGVNNEQYLLEMNPAKNIWMLKPNPRATQQKATADVAAKLAQEQKAKAECVPAGDTESKADIPEAVTS